MAGICDPKDGCGVVQRHDERINNHERRIVALETGQDVIHDRITAEQQDRLTDDRDQARRFAYTIIGIGITAIFSIIGLILQGIALAKSINSP